MCGGLEELHAHLVRPGDLQPARRLVDAGEHCTAGGNLDAVLVAAGVCDHGHLVCKAVYGLLDGGFVVEGTGAHFAPCGVQRALERACDGVCRGGREVLPCAAGLPRTGVQQVVEGGALLEGLRLLAVVVVDLVLGFQCSGRGLLHQAADLGLALAGIPGQKLHHILADGLGLLVAPELPVRRRRQGVHPADAPGNVL